MLLNLALPAACLVINPPGAGQKSQHILGLLATTQISTANSTAGFSVLTLADCQARIIHWQFGGPRIPAVRFLGLHTGALYASGSPKRSDMSQDVAKQFCGLILEMITPTVIQP